MAAHGARRSNRRACAGRTAFPHFLVRRISKKRRLIAYGPNLSEMFRRCGEYVGKVLHGAKPSELPIQRPERFDLVINLKSATAIGLDMPAQLQQLADEVIE